MRIVWNTLKRISHTDTTDYLQNRPCPICKKSENKTVLTLNNFQFFSDESFAKQIDIQQRQCNSCGAVFMNPCYSNRGFEVLFSEASQSYGSTSIRPLEQVRWLQQYHLLESGHRVLDIGCGTGNFLSNLPEEILKVGVDIDLPSIQIAKEKYPTIEFICSSFENLTYDATINTITMFHVLEHLPNPLETLQRLYHLSDNSTKLVVEIPIIENGFTNDINGFLSVQHLTHFSRTSFKNILALSGWEVLEWLEQKEYNGCRILAQKGLPAQTILKGHNEYLNVYHYLSHWYQSIGEIEKKILSQKIEKCVIWGAGMHLEFLYQLTSLFHQNMECIIVDSDKNKQLKSWRGLMIYDPHILTTLEQPVSVLISSYGGQNSIYQAALSFGIPEKNIIKLYDHIRVY